MNERCVHPDRLTATACLVQRGRGTFIVRMIIGVILGVMALLMAASSAYAGDIDKAKLNKLKAAYLYNLLKFTHWPESKFEDDSEAIRVVLVGHSPVTDVFLQAVKHRTAQKREIICERIDYPGVRNGQEPNEAEVLALDAFYKKLRASHMVFIDAGQSMHWRDLRTQLSEAGTLLVSDMDSFAQAGGMVGLALNKENRLGFVVNLDTVQAAELRISSSLLKLAEVIGGTQSSATDDPPHIAITDAAIWLTARVCIRHIFGGLS